MFQIKRRPDGTRYVTKKPIRNKLLKEREQQLNKVSCFSSSDFQLKRKKFPSLFFYQIEDLNVLRDVFLKKLLFRNVQV